MVGLIHPTDLHAWQAWQSRRRGVHGIIGRARAARTTEPTRFHLTLGGPHPRILIALESLSPSQQAALLTPAAHLPPADVAVLSLDPVQSLLPEHAWASTTTTDPATTPALDDIAAVLAVGHYLPAGAAAHRLATARNLPFGVVQHGLLVPVAPPLPPHAHLLAWSSADGEFWASGRSDVSVEVVGSQMFWAAREPRAELLSTERMITWADRRPIYLGQLHGAEIGRWRMARAAEKTLQRTNAVYRPHPHERDRMSRFIHKAWQRRGITVDRSGTPLTAVEAPVLGVFSTGILEAACRGIPAWVDFDRPPSWLGEFWERYGMGRLGGAPTSPPVGAIRAPADTVSDWLRSVAMDT